MVATGKMIKMVASPVVSMNDVSIVVNFDIITKLAKIIIILCTWKRDKTSSSN
jgi:hypothetical protein